MSSVEVADVYVQDDPFDRRERRAAERSRYEQALGVFRVHGRDSAPKPTAGRQFFTRRSKLEPVPTKVVAPAFHRRQRSAAG
jgi:hypothetical protein